jgi:hypothetical protein
MAVAAPPLAVMSLDDAQIFLSMIFSENRFPLFGIML